MEIGPNEQSHFLHSWEMFYHLYFHRLSKISPVTRFRPCNIDFTDRWQFGTYTIKHCVTWRYGMIDRSVPCNDTNAGFRLEICRYEQYLSATMHLCYESSYNIWSICFEFPPWPKIALMIPAIEKLFPGFNKVTEIWKLCNTFRIVSNVNRIHCTSSNDALRK